MDIVNTKKVIVRERVSNKNCHLILNKPRLIQLPKSITAFVLLVNISNSKYKLKKIAAIKEHKFKTIRKKRLTNRPKPTINKNPIKGKNNKLRNIVFS